MSILCRTVWFSFVLRMAISGGLSSGNEEIYSAEVKVPVTVHAEVSETRNRILAERQVKPESGLDEKQMRRNRSTKASFTVFPERVIGTIDPNIYGHFVEHVGRVVYGGIWAEMLANRSFEGQDYDKNGLPDPWEPILGADGNVGVEVSDAFRGRQALRLDGGPHGRAGTRQKDLGLRVEWIYDLEIWVKETRSPTRLEVRLESEDGHNLCSVQMENLLGEWRCHRAALKPNRDEEAATLYLEMQGEGSVVVDSVSLMPRENNEGGIRKDIVDLVRDMNPPVIRYPGGCYADGYHWKNGVGPREKRPISSNELMVNTAKKVFQERLENSIEMPPDEFERLFERNTWCPYEMNDFGTDEFIRFSRMVGAEPFITVNFGSGSPEEAADWVAYCNSSASDPRGAMRAANGYPEPYNVKYWGIGNEIWGPFEVGHCSPEEYGKGFAAFAKAMRAVDPNIKLVAVGSTPEGWNEDWNARVLSTEAAREMDYLSIHRYYGYGRGGGKTVSREESAKTVMAASVHLGSLLDKMRETIRKVVSDERNIAIVLEEWGTWHDFMIGLMKDSAMGPYTMVDGVYAAGVFHELQRRCNSVTMGNMAQLVNTIGAVRANHTAAFGTPYQIVFSLFANYCQPLALEVTGESPTYDAVATADAPELKNVPLVDIAATRDESSEMFVITALNRDIAVEADLKVLVQGVRASKAKVVELKAEDVFSVNTFETPDNITTKVTTISLQDGSIEYRLAPHSLTLFVIGPA